MHHVAILDDVVLALEAHAPGFLRALLAVELHVVVVGDHLGPDEAALEAQIADLEPEDKALFLDDMGMTEPGLDRLIRAAYALLGLQTYLTAGPKESRAWTIPRGATAPEAAGVIHTDFQRGFIKAEIVSYDDLVAAGSMAAAKAAGRVRMEGKDYVMQDGDVVEFRFNV